MLRDDMTVKELFTQAFRRIDGIAMYLVCLLFTTFSAYAAIARYLSLSLFMPYSKAMSSVLLAPVVFMAYVYLAYFSTSGRVSRVVNAGILFTIPFLFFYKSLH